MKHTKVSWFPGVLKGVNDPQNHNRQSLSHHENPESAFGNKEVTDKETVGKTLFAKIKTNSGSSSTVMSTAASLFKFT